MPRGPLAACLLVLGTLPTLTRAADAVPQAPAPGRSWDFTLPTLDGSRFVRASGFKGPVLINFWSKDCDACIAELPRLQAFAQSHRRWTVLLVSTDPPSEARQFVQRHAVALEVLRPGANVTALMRSAGDHGGMLPFTVGLQASRICTSQLGALTMADLQHMDSTCEQPDGT